MNKTRLIKSTYLAFATSAIACLINRLFASVTGYILGIETYGEGYFAYRGFGWIEITEVPAQINEEIYMNLTHTFKFDPLTFILTAAVLFILFDIALKKLDANKEYYKSLF